eukprot:TRINITY_DN63536_c0_g1_i1.p1 TRINITY_DN63536_c0_g1~~TRINITY_DN63536_c0_g1_i1.p1  ORF type:complete len:368 (+),score=81.06 TRINITY_DN63536_c0_g1_i1:85-1188(+)
MVGTKGTKRKADAASKASEAELAGQKKKRKGGKVKAPTESKPDEQELDDEEAASQDETEALFGLPKKSANSGEAAKIYVGGLTCPCDEQALRQKFSKYGHIENLTIPPGRRGKQGTKCIAFLTFSKLQEAEAALKADGSDYKNSTIKVEMAGGNSAKGTRVYVGGLGPTVDESTGVKKHFAKCGDIVKFEVPPSRKKKDETRGFVYITYSDEMGAESALRLNDTMYKGKIRLTVQYATSDKELAQKQGKDEFSVAVTNLPKCDEESLRAHFASCGPIRNYKQSRGIVVISFKSKSGRMDALKLDGQEYRGRPLKVAEAKARINGVKRIQKEEQTSKNAKEVKAASVRDAAKSAKKKKTKKKAAASKT